MGDVNALVKKAEQLYDQYGNPAQQSHPVRKALGTAALLGAGAYLGHKGLQKVAPELHGKLAEKAKGLVSRVTGGRVGANHGDAAINSIHDGAAHFAASLNKTDVRTKEHAREALTQINKLDKAHKYHSNFAADAPFTDSGGNHTTHGTMAEHASKMADLILKKVPGAASLIAK